MKNPIEPKPIEFTRRGVENQDVRAGLPFEADKAMERQSFESSVDSAATIEKKILADIDQSNATPFVSDLVDSRSRFLSAPESVPKAPQVPTNPIQDLGKLIMSFLRGAFGGSGMGCPYPQHFRFASQKIVAKSPNDGVVRLKPSER